MAASAAARPGSAQIIFSAALFAFAQSNEGLPDSAALPALAASTKTSAGAMPPHVNRSSIAVPSVSGLARNCETPPNSAPRWLGAVIEIVHRTVSLALHAGES